MKQFDAKPIFVQDTVILVNPNPDRSYKVAAQGRGIEFLPLEPMEVPREVAMHLLYKAEQARANAEINYNDVRMEYMKRAGSGKYIDKMRAERYLDDEGNLCVQKWKMVPLVDLGTVQGKELFEKGQELKAKMEAGEVKRAEDPSIIVNEHELLEPKMNWNRDKLREYLKERNVTYGPNEDAASLLRKATNNFLLLKETLEAAHVKVKVL